MNVHPIIARLGAELVEKPRLRLGVWAIGAILLGYFVFAAQSERLAAVAADHADTATRLARARSLLAREDWAERVDAARAAERALTDRFWRADNSGLAQAQLRSAVEALMEEEDLNVDRSTIKLGLSHPVDDVPGLWQVQVQLSGTARKGGVLRVLQAIAAHPNKLLEEQLNITRLRNDRRGDTRFDMLLSAYFIIGATDPANPDTRGIGADTRRSSGPDTRGFDADRRSPLARTHGVPPARTDADLAGTHGVPPARTDADSRGHTAFLRPVRTRIWPGHTAFLRPGHTRTRRGHTAFLRPGHTRTRRGHTAFLRPGHTAFLRPGQTRTRRARGLGADTRRSSGPYGRGFGPDTRRSSARTHGVPPHGHTAFLRPGHTRTRRGHTAFLRPVRTRIWPGHTAFLRTDTRRSSGPDTFLRPVRTRTRRGHTAFLRPGHTAFLRPGQTRTRRGHTAFLRLRPGHTRTRRGHTAFLRPVRTRIWRGHTAFLRPGHTRISRIWRGHTEFLRPGQTRIWPGHTAFLRPGDRRGFGPDTRRSSGRTHANLTRANLTRTDAR